MKTLIVYRSYHRMNTQKIARAMAEATGATLVTVDEVRPGDLADYGLVGFGSGIYGGKHHADLFALVEDMPAAERAVFLFSTSAGEGPENHRALREALVAKGCRVAGEFACRGEFCILRFVTKNRGHPDETDLAAARTFARGLVAA
ncbi:MAG: flavodoxin [Methanospirillum sp.]|nr:flavodoxin [Methanospirillum sp.]